MSPTISSARVTGRTRTTATYGYLGQAQLQFNLTRGFNDSKFNSTPQGSNVNLRESLFDTEKPRHNAMMFGEHLGQPPPYGDYFNVGMRLVDNPLQGAMNGILGNPSAGLQGLDQPGSYGFGGDDSGISVMYAQSHDNDYAITPGTAVCALSDPRGARFRLHRRQPSVPNA